MYYRLVKKFFQRAGKKMCLECKDFIRSGSKILDLGCGSGTVGKEFQKYFNADLIGIDIEDKRIEDIPFQIFDGFQVPFTDNFFDVILINYVLHHTKDPIFILGEAKRVSKNKIVIFEDLPETFLSDLICYFHGAIFNWFFQRHREKHNFKRGGEWKKIFEKLRLKLIFEKKVSSKLDPVEKKLFVLEKMGD